MKTYIWADTAYVSQDFFVVSADNIIIARLKLAYEIEELEKAFMEQAAREDQASYRTLMRSKFKGWIMYINQASVGLYLVHVVPGGKASPNQTVVDEAKQLGPKYWDFLHNLTLFALVSVKAS